MQAAKLSAEEYSGIRGGAGMRIYTIIGGVDGVGKSSLSGVLSAESRNYYGFF